MNKMLLLQILVCLGLLAITEGRIAQCHVKRTTCPCANPDWCKPVESTVKNEVFIFVVAETNWPRYDWSRVTTLAQFGKINDSLTCYAHSKGVRSVYGANFPVGNLTNAADRARWVIDQVIFAGQHFLDGINVDFESIIDKNDTATRNGLTSLMQELAIAFRASFDTTQISVDFAWSPDCIDKRCYDYVAIANIVDLVFIMSYDERSQIYGDCIAFANSALNTTIHGVERYLSLGLSPRKMVLGVPWYGYFYPCITLDKENVCSIQKIPFCGVACSDAAGTELDYSIIINDKLPTSTSGLLWNAEANSPYFNWKDSKSGKMYQIWFDNPQSLTYKYKYAMSRDLLGVGMWHADALDYSDTPTGRKQRQQMWGAIPYIK